jgi:hypothetical protein
MPSVVSPWREPGSPLGSNHRSPAAQPRRRVSGDFPRYRPFCHFVSADQLWQIAFSPVTTTPSMAYGASLPHSAIWAQSRELPFVSFSNGRGLRGGLRRDCSDRNRPPLPRSPHNGDLNAALGLCEKMPYNVGAFLYPTPGEKAMSQVETLPAPLLPAPAENKWRREQQTFRRLLPKLMPRIVGSTNSMANIIICPGCHRRLLVPIEQGNLTVRCPTCACTWTWPQEMVFQKGPVGAQSEAGDQIKRSKNEPEPSCGGGYGIGTKSGNRRCECCGSPCDWNASFCSFLCETMYNAG